LQKEELKQILREIKSQSDAAGVREKAGRLLSSVDPKVLSLAEQDLMKEGFAPEELGELCDVHLQLLSGKIERQRVDDPEQPIIILKEEHTAILGYVDNLEQIARKLGAGTSSKLSQDDLSMLRNVSEMLLEAENHHKREEDVLFPRLEQRGIGGPPAMMRLEHKELRTRKKALKELVGKVDKLNERDFSKQLEELAEYIVPTFRNHIFKENNILYPTALQAIPASEWTSIQTEFDRIGYCPFTPKRTTG